MLRDVTISDLMVYVVASFNHPDFSPDGEYRLLVKDLLSDSFFDFREQNVSIATVDHFLFNRSRRDFAFKRIKDRLESEFDGYITLGIEIEIAVSFNYPVSVTDHDFAFYNGLPLMQKIVYLDIGGRLINTNTANASPGATRYLGDQLSASTLDEEALYQDVANFAVSIGFVTK